MLKEETHVSTVFLGYDRDQLFETMIFGGLLDGIPWRSGTLVDAKKCHYEAVLKARQLSNLMRRHGLRIKRDWVRLYNFRRLVRKRGNGWAIKHEDVARRAFLRLRRLPGQPPLPQPNVLFEMAESFMGRPTLAKDPIA